MSDTNNMFLEQYRAMKLQVSIVTGILSGMMILLKTTLESDARTVLLMETLADCENRLVKILGEGPAIELDDVIKYIVKKSEGNHE